jgi:hypothetical protein
LQNNFSLSRGYGGVKASVLRNWVFEFKTGAFIEETVFESMDFIFAKWIVAGTFSNPAKRIQLLNNKRHVNSARLRSAREADCGAADAKWIHSSLPTISPGNPDYAARCEIPESCPANPPACLSHCAKSASGGRCATLIRCGGGGCQTIESFPSASPQRGEPKIG